MMSQLAEHLGLFQKKVSSNLNVGSKRFVLKKLRFHLVNVFQEKEHSQFYGQTGQYAARKLMQIIRENFHLRTNGN